MEYQLYERSLPELKEEILLRLQRNQHPLRELQEADVKLVLDRLNTKDPDVWAQEWGNLARTYEEKGKYLSQNQKDKEAAAAYYQASRYYCFARWPVPYSEGKKVAYDLSLQTFLQSTSSFDPPLKRIAIPFKGKQIVGYLRLPKTRTNPPLIFHWGGIDHWKEDFQYIVETYLSAGWGSFIIDMPGTGESPIMAKEDGRELFSTVLDYLQQRGDINKDRIALQGSSWGGYWAVKMAYLEHKRIRAAVNWGGPVHHFFQPDWQKYLLQTQGYLFGQLETLRYAYKVATFEEGLVEAPKLSLQSQGILEQPSAPLLSVNGKNDTLVPIQDLYLLAEASSPKSFWINPNGMHMGHGRGISSKYILNSVIIPWLYTHLEMNFQQDEVRS